jgi:hypothetical protein
MLRCAVECGRCGSALAAVAKPAFNTHDAVVHQPLPILKGRCRDELATTRIQYSSFYSAASNASDGALARPAASSEGAVVAAAAATVAAVSPGCSKAKTSRVGSSLVSSSFIFSDVQERACFPFYQTFYKLCWCTSRPCMRRPSYRT